MSKNLTKVWQVTGLLGYCIAFAQAGNIGVNTENPGSTMDINGSLAAKYSSIITTPYNLSATDFYVSYNGTSNAVFNLPSAIIGEGNFKGRMYTIKNNTSFTITVNSAGSETINGSTNTSVPSNQSIQLISTGLTGVGNTWEIITGNNNTANSITSSNGITISGGDVKLGGTLSQATNIVTAGNNLSINGTGKVLVGTTTVPVEAATAKIVIDNGTTNGALQIKDGTQQFGYVLTSDANGLASWSSTTTTAFANNWTSYSGTLVNPYTGSIGGGGLITGISVIIPAKGWYFFRSGLTIQSNCNDYSFYINGIGDIWRTYCNVADLQMLSPRDQNRVLYFSSPGTYPIYAVKTNAVVPTAFNMGNPTFYLDFVKFQN
ncbi:autotransporter outer membrane beta-barrel domain-containing protein [Chryseobacterium polytrichastri]|uniref:PA14 domain-containing protein n=1 Tax=Chryseobacterium polytrichastri TaxID=1302687 RepID=A0A1M6RVX2_9FLAO|nr:hypothetical protein [Chryseobacterium polytrichastri]SHK36604.1 hypothetical protein SAMN05444267_100393 [Chryseobacterium polytrichastri]